MFRFVDEAREGRLEQRRQDSAYVGLSRTRARRPDPAGRIIKPVSRVGAKQALSQIRSVDVVLGLWLMATWGVLVMDTAELEACLTPDLARELQEMSRSLTEAGGTG